MEEELELFTDIEEDEEETPLIINGDVYITINNGVNKTNLKKIRRKITKPLKERIKKRDSKRCLCCGKIFENNLEVHHIMPLSKYPDLVADTENLASLCQKCHAKYHNMYKDNEGAVTFAMFLKQYGK